MSEPKKDPWDSWGEADSAPGSAPTKAAERRTRSEDLAAKRPEASWVSRDCAHHAKPSKGKKKRKPDVALRVTITLDLGGRDARHEGMGLVKGVLDAGTLQDALNEWARDRGHKVKVVSATAFAP